MHVCFVPDSELAARHEHKRSTIGDALGSIIATIIAVHMK